MNEHLPTSVELVQARLRIPDLTVGTAEVEILRALENTEGVQSMTVHEGELHVVYDPLLTSAHELEALIAQSGHPVTGDQTERDSPLRLAPDLPFVSPQSVQAKPSGVRSFCDAGMRTFRSASVG
jgi:hypothetical protein